MTIDLLQRQRLIVQLPDGSELVLEHSPNRLHVEHRVDGRLDTLIRVPLDDSTLAA